jgi:hypothetical protein
VAGRAQCSLPLERLGSGAYATTDNLPLMTTTSTKEGASEVPDKRPDARERPSDEEGLKRSQSGTSSPTARDALEDGEKGVALGFRGEWEHWGVGVPVAGWPGEGEMASTQGLGEK